jgi:two-component system, NarL family, response regulator NreC
MMNAGKYVGCISFDLHPAATAIALLTAPKFPVDELLVHLKAGGQARQKGHQSLSVRLPRCEVPKHKRLILNDSGQEFGLRERRKSTLLIVTANGCACTIGQSSSTKAAPASRHGVCHFPNLSGRGGIVYLDEQATSETAAESKIRCVIADDHALVRQGIRRLLQDENDVEVIGEAGDAAEALKSVMELRPDILLMDVGMPGFSSFEAARIIQRDLPGTRVVFLTMHEDQDYVMQGLQAGASGYLLKDTPAAKLISVLRDVHQGGKFVSPEVLGGLIDNGKLGQTPLRPAKSSLTPREQEVMKLLAEGNTVRKIAGMLGLSLKTIEAHKFNLMRKLDIHNKAELVHCAIRRKIVKVPAGF